MDTNNLSGSGDSPRLSLSSEILLNMRKSPTAGDLLRAVLPRFRDFFALECIGLIGQQDGQWQIRAWDGVSRSQPESLVPRAVDQNQVVTSGSWMAIPLVEPSAAEASSRNQGFGFASSAFVLQAKEVNWDDDSVKCLQAERGIQCLQAAMDQLVKSDLASQRLIQLTAVLESAASWQRLDDDQSLLEAIAATATEILNCERASIFLWDRKRKKLIGQPALGVPGGVLEVDDSVGVVGEVLQSESSKIWNRGNDEESRVNRKVDQSLEFETHSLVAVPMFGQRGRVIGVFEAINHTSASFNESHALVLDDLANHASAAIESQKVRKDLTATRDRLIEDAAASSPLIGKHPLMLSIGETATKVAGTDLGVLIRGGNGTGKEVLARTIHYESNRRAGPFIAVNCAALVETLLESELFGHEKGSFTDAQTTRVGKFELANQGTLFLDEVGDMSPGGQAKLLRVLEEKVVVRVGGSQPIPVDVRVIAATNQPLEDLIKKKLFREDLFFRLNVVNLTLPDLSDRGEDVLVLAEHFLSQFCSQIGRRVPEFKPSARQVLLSYAWPGNIRELRNTIERVAYLCSDDEIEPHDLMLNPSSLASTKRPSLMKGTLNDATREFQVEHIRRVIDSCEGKMTEAAKLLGLHRSNLYRKMHQLGMSTNEDSLD